MNKLHSQSQFYPTPLQRPPVPNPNAQHATQPEPQPPPIKVHLSQNLPIMDLIK